MAPAQGVELEECVIGVQADADLADRTVAAEIVLPHQSEVIVGLAELLADAAVVAPDGGNHTGELFAGNAVWEIGEALKPLS